METNNNPTREEIIDEIIVAIITMAEINLTRNNKELAVKEGQFEEASRLRDEENELWAQLPSVGRLKELKELVIKTKK